MLFVPWIYRALEEEGVKAREFARRADVMERDLIEVMRKADARLVGVLGGRSGRRLRRLPSAVYWAGLGAWGVRVLEASQDQYHRNIDVIYQRRAEQAAQRRERASNKDDDESAPAPDTITWHLKLPPAPRDFPRVVDFRLTEAEAGFLIDRIKRRHPESLLAWLAQHNQPVDVEAPWLHPALASLSGAHRELLDHARRFSEVMHGAALAYNLALAQARGWEEMRQQHLHGLEQWAQALDPGDARGWELERLWALTSDQGHTITPKTRGFVERWVERVKANPSRLGQDEEALALVRQREEALKGGRSRFRNRRALEQWGGASGLGRLTYRWPTVTTFLRDLALARRLEAS
jgi:hypothetical protein